MLEIVRLCYQKRKSSLAERAEAVRDRLVQPYEDNMLKITNDGRKLALDQRLINDMLPDDENLKAATCVNKAFEIWKKTKEQKSTQLIFCDLSTPKGDGTFNVYEDIRNKLMEKGVPENEIAFIHDANTELRKAEQFAITIGGKAYTDKKEAVTAIIAMCKEIKGINASADVGEYLGFKLNVTFDSFNNKFVMNVKGAMSHPMEVGADPLGNITRINNALEAMPAQLEEAQTKLSNVEHQLETAKAEVNKPFAQEAELSEKLDRLTALNALLNMDEKGNDAIGMDEEGQEAEPERKLADRPAERTSLKGRLSEMKARVSGIPAGRDAVDKTRGNETIR